MPLALLALAIGAFGIGTTEFVIMGVLPQVAGDFGVTIPTAGWLVSGYALGVVIGAPLLTVLGTKVSRKKMLMFLMALFVVGNALSAVAPASASCSSAGSSPPSRTARSSASVPWSPPTWWHRRRRPRPSP
jgi:predicted MFS family arabinose efflux permease